VLKFEVSTFQVCGMEYGLCVVWRATMDTKKNNKQNFVLIVDNKIKGNIDKHIHVITLSEPNSCRMITLLNPNRFKSLHIGLNRSSAYPFGDAFSNRAVLVFPKIISDSQTTVSISHERLESSMNATNSVVVVICD